MLAAWTYITTEGWTIAAEQTDELQSGNLFVQLSAEPAAQTAFVSDYTPTD